MYDSLQALSAYITSQKELLARTHSDIERLHELQKKASSNPATVVDKLAEEVGRTSALSSGFGSDLGKAE